MSDAEVVLRRGRAQAMTLPRKNWAEQKQPRRYLLLKKWAVGKRQASSSPRGAPVL